MNEILDSKIQLDQSIPTGVSRPKINLLQKMLMAIGVTFLGLICLCVGGFTLLVFLSFRTAEDNKDQWLVVSEAYMDAMAEQRYDAAYALFAAEARRDFQRSELQALAESPFGVLFAGYQDLEITKWNVEFNTSGTMVDIEGLVNYSNGDTGSFDATLKKKGDSWQLFWFNVNLSPKKLNESSGAKRGS